MGCQCLSVFPRLTWQSYWNTMAVSQIVQTLRTTGCERNHREAWLMAFAGQSQNLCYLAMLPWHMWHWLVMWMMLSVVMPSYVVLSYVIGTDHDALWLSVVQWMCHVVAWQLAGTWVLWCIPPPTTISNKAFQFYINCNESRDDHCHAELSGLAMPFWS